MLKKKIWANFQRIKELFNQKIANKLSKIWVWDPGSESWEQEKTYSGSRIQGSKRHRITDPGSAILLVETSSRRASEVLFLFKTHIDFTVHTSFDISQCTFRITS
jgi:hypothetical protein